MANIKITLSANSRLYADSPRDEAAWLERAGHLHYPLQCFPKRAGLGDWVYFIHRRKVVGRARILGIEPGKSRLTFTRIRRPAPPAALKVAAPISPVTKGLMMHPGFPGFRYVTSREEVRLARLFS
jgi:hypothetical protein